MVHLCGAFVQCTVPIDSEIFVQHFDLYGENEFLKALTFCGIIK
jgi:hypothetical protein